MIPNARLTIFRVDAMHSLHPHTRHEIHHRDTLYAASSQVLELATFSFCTPCHVNVTRLLQLPTCLFLPTVYRRQFFNLEKLKQIWYL
jgi:hypothetical protein